MNDGTDVVTAPTAAPPAPARTVVEPAEAAPRAGGAPEPAVNRRSVLAELREIGAELWQHRELLYQLTLRDVRIRYKQAVIGFGWALLMPGLIVLSGILVRLAMAYVSGTSLESSEVTGIAVKALPWAFFVGAIGFATSSLTGNGNLVTKIYFPREVLPISAVLATAFDSLIGAFVLLAVLPLLGASFSAALLWVPVLALLVFLLTAGAGILLSCGNLFFRDVKYIVQVLLTFGIFFTPVFFDADTFGPAGVHLIMLNPIAPLLEGLRLSVAHGHNLLMPLVETTVRGDQFLVWSPWHLVYSAAWAVFGMVGAAVLFHKLEFIFAEYV